MPNAIVFIRVLESVKKGYYSSVEELESDLVDYFKKHTSKKYDSLGKILNEQVRTFLDNTALEVKRYFTKNTVMVQGREVKVVLEVGLPPDAGSLQMPKPLTVNTPHWLEVVVPLGKQQESRLFDFLAYWNPYSEWVRDYLEKKGVPQTEDLEVVGQHFKALWDLVRDIVQNGIVNLLVEAQKKDLDEEAKTLGLTEEEEPHVKPSGT